MTKCNIYRIFAFIYLFLYVVQCSKGEFDLTVELGKPDIIVSPGYYYGRYPSNIYTSWTLTSTEDILLYCLDFDVETCCGNTVFVSFLSEVYHNQYQVDSTYLVHSKKAFLHSDERLQIVFKSNGTEERPQKRHEDRRGFVFKFLALSKKRQKAQHEEEYFASADTLSQLVLNSIQDPTIESLRVTIKALIGYRLRISVVYTDMVSSMHCIEDFIQIYEGHSHSKILLLHKCNNVTTSASVEIISLSDSVIVEYSCKISSTIASLYLSNICGVLNYQAVAEHFDNSSVIEEETVNFPVSPSWLVEAYRSVFTLDTSHLRVALSSVMGLGLRLQRYNDVNSYSDYVEILIDFTNKSVMTTNINMNIIGRPKENYYDQRAWTWNTSDIFWVLVKDLRLWFGHGSTIGVEALSYIDIGHLFEFNAVSLKGSSGNATILSESDDMYISQHQTLLTNVSGDIQYTHTSNSYAYKLWLIETQNEDDILILNITQNQLVETADCLLERVSIYRGNFPRKSKRLTYFCGDTYESYTQTVRRLTTIEYITSPVPISFLEDQGLMSNRSFTISYQIITTTRSGLPTKVETMSDEWSKNWFIGVGVTFVVFGIIVGWIFYKLKSGNGIRLQFGRFNAHIVVNVQPGRRLNRLNHLNPRIDSHLNHPRMVYNSYFSHGRSIRLW